MSILAGGGGVAGDPEEPDGALLRRRRWCALGLALATLTAVADDGTLVYLRGGSTEPKRVLVWVEAATGKTTPIAVPEQPYEEPRLSPDETHAALAARVLSAAGDLKTGLASEGPLPSRQDIRILVEELLEVLFPESHRLGTDGGSLQDHVAATIGSLEARLETAIFLGLHRLCRGKSGTISGSIDKGGKRARAITGKLLEALPEIRAELAKDILAADEDGHGAVAGVEQRHGLRIGVVHTATGLVAAHHERVLDTAGGDGVRGRLQRGGGRGALAARHAVGHRLFARRHRGAARRGRAVGAERCRPRFRRRRGGAHRNRRREPLGRGSEVLV